ncbi:snaclec convulxin subunit beta-like [Patiria miniata]|uniref:C-type lectin domain-containing protein n=1 Tax=Patiria miniata TaxID=46514 RepID=A0A913ZSN0_PATMI|nr:snaclec convulxin subunit beta-like [Patiria miniata]
MVSQRFIFGLISLHLMMGCTGGNEMCKASIGHGWACPPTWYQWGRKCYKAMITERMTWSEAKEECIKKGSVLVVPHSHEETDFLMRLVPENSKIWINCNDLEEEGTWKCQDGTDEEEYRNWSQGEPDNLRGIWKCQDGNDEVVYRNWSPGEPIYMRGFEPVTRTSHIHPDHTKHSKDKMKLKTHPTKLHSTMK